MLTHDSLVEQAKLRGVPPTKMRGILREYLQILILKELNRTEFGKKLYFTGGTYLRLIHDLKRFSEDLDFNAQKITKQGFETLLRKVKLELERVGLGLEVKLGHWNNIYVAKLIFPEIEKHYGIISKYSKKQGIIIKIETNQPRWKIKSETQVISGFGEIYPCVCTDRSALFADKIDALTKKSRGRHIYDILFMISNKFPISRSNLRILGIKKDPLEVIHDSIKRFSKTELKKQAEILRPFLFDEREAELVINAQTIIASLLDKYRKV